MAIVGIIAALLASLLVFGAAAETVTPSERVRQYIDVRLSPSRTGDRVDVLRPGETATLLERVPRWYKVRLPNGREGYVSKSWATVLPDAPAIPALGARQVDELRIHFFNTGAGTCTIIECPGIDARPIIADCGSSTGSRDENALSDAALKARFAEILASHPSPNVVLSHGDADHYNLISTVLDGISVNEIWQGDSVSSYSQKFDEWIAGQVIRGAKRRSGFPQSWHNSGQPIQDGLQCGTAATSVLTVNSGGSNNANSLVLMVEYQDFTAIFAGDAEGTTESSAIRNFGGNIRATLLTGSHHGANTRGSNSTAWAQATLPTVVIYSAGTMYGHPRCLAAERLDDALATVAPHNAICGTSNDAAKRYTTRRAEYMTRVNGTVTVTTSGRSPLHMRCEIGPGCDARIPH